jgi:hypothetical protein
MPKKLCCCDAAVDDYCLTNQFVTIFGPLLDSAVPVSSGDLISLKINRPESKTRNKELTHRLSDVGAQPCPACCTACAIDACQDCPLVSVCENNRCTGPQEGQEPYIAAGAGRSDYGQPCIRCCSSCGGDQDGGEGPDTGNPLLLRQATTVFSDNSPFNVSRMFKKLFNRGTQTPMEYGTSYNIKTFEEMAQENIKKVQKNNLINSNINLDSNQVNSPVIVRSSNEIFKNKLDNLYPACKECLIENGYDIDCIRNNSPNCVNKNIDFCKNCKKECEAYCSPYFGDTINQQRNISNLFGLPIYTTNYDLAKGSTFNNSDLYLGNILVNGTGLIKIIDPLETTLDQSRSLLAGGAETDAFYGPEVDGPDTVPADDPNEPFKLSESCLPYACSVCNFNGGAPGSDPLYFIYRYSGCHMVWYPPEYIFNYQLKIPQGSAYYKKERVVDSNGIGSMRDRLKSCDFLISAGGHQQDGNVNGIEQNCSGNYFNNGQACSQAGCQCRDATTYPCQCVRFPHLSGGFTDTVKKRFNVSQRINQGGYLPSLDPFLPKMYVQEAGCCSCANTSCTAPCTACNPGFDIIRNKRSAWPRASGNGKSPPALGQFCNVDQNQNEDNGPFYNPRYNKACFERGISPYLSRISQRLFVAARDIFHYGSVDPKKQEILGPFYTSTILQPRSFGWSKAGFKKTFNKKSNLFHKMVGLIGMDHHFECWAYHSKALFTPAPPIAMNHCNMLITPYEKPYGGEWTKRNFTYDPREAFRYQAMRHFPRRVMYGSSVIPLFHSDLHAMEELSEAKEIKINGDVFDGERFLEAFYLYFYNRITDPGDTLYAEPAIEQSDVDQYDYVSSWLKEMIKANVISVKDHADDIGKELIELLDGVYLEPIDPEHPPIDGRPDPDFIDDTTESFLGKKAGYYEMIDWLKANILAQYPEANFSNTDDFTIWAAMKPYITAKFIKNVLINPRQENLVSTIPGPMFAGPRRAKLWPCPNSAGLTSWGCTGTNECYDKENVLNVLTDSDPDNLLEYNKLFGGQQTWFAITNNGKVRAFGRGAIPPSGNDDPTEIGCSIDYNPVCPDANGNGVEPPCSPYESGPICDGPYYDTDVGAVPCHLSVLPELGVLYEEDQANNTLPDGIVQKISSKGNFAVALVEYQEGVVPGTALYHWHTPCNETNYKRKKHSNSGWAVPGTINSYLYSPYSFTCADTDSADVYTLKAWGKGNNGDDDADIDYGIFYNDTRYVSDYIQPNCDRLQNAFDSNLYNKFFVWRDVACGAKHTIAIISGGYLFATPTSDNTYNQSSYGYPTISGKRESAEDRATQQISVGSYNEPLGYYYNLPKPGYFTEDEWNTLHPRNSVQTLPENKDWWSITHCVNRNQPGDVSWSEGENAIPCDIRCQLFVLNQSGLRVPLGSDRDNPCGANYGYSCLKVIEPDFPVYTQVAAGHYHSIALSDDNNLKIWGSYVKVDENGEPVTEGTSFTSTDPIPVFLPESEIFKDEWILGPIGGVTGCNDLYAREADAPEGYDHSKYKVYTTADKTVYSSASIFAIDGGPDYSIMARKAGDKHRLVVWGNSEMVKAVSGVTYSGLTAFYGKNYDVIDQIVAGPNAIGVIWKRKNSPKKRLDIFQRPDANRGLTIGIDKNRYSDICFTAGSVSAIFSSGSKAQEWKASSFDSDHSKLQFKNFNNLPLYFRTQAFFRAVPGRWDFSKWLFGMPCNQIGTDVGGNIVGNPDYTSPYYTITRDEERSYSGHPQYYWMRPDQRRKQQATPLHTYEPYPGKVCGMMRDRNGRDGLKPQDEFGGGGDPNGAIASANRALNNELGGCYGGDICWVGDGSPSSFAYYSDGYTPPPVCPRPTPGCVCNDLLCGCPPGKRWPQIYDCSAGPFGSARCFGYLNNRIGFYNNKDYFVQSSKSFGELSDTNSRNGLGFCCGVIKTNITAFFYAKRNYYYGYNEETSLYEVQNAPLPYRSHFVGTSYPEPGKSYGMTSSELVNAIMTPRNSIIGAYTVQSVFPYPYVFLGGQSLKKLQLNLQSSVILSGCDRCNPPPPGATCFTDSNCGYPPDSTDCRASVGTLVGPGGWVNTYGRQICNDGSAIPITVGGMLNDSVNGALNSYLYLETTKTDNWLGPLVSFKGYTGPLPPGMTITCNCWCGDNTSFSSSSQPCSCSRDQYPSGSCPNNDRSCPGCKFCCKLNDNLIYQVDTESSIDDPKFYYPADKRLPGMGDNDESIPVGFMGGLWRVYEEIPSSYNSLGCTGYTLGAPRCFLGLDGLTNPGKFNGNCESGVPVGRVSAIDCVEVQRSQE